VEVRRREEESKKKKERNSCSLAPKPYSWINMALLTPNILLAEKRASIPVAFH
jgi:hypothetical protein